jgi:lysozyme
VSHHQGEINWPEVIDSFDSITPFVYCKATEGETHVDTQFKQNRKELTALNIKHGAYHFFLPNVDALKQAVHFLSEYDFHQYDLPPVLDYEIEPKNEDEQLIKILAWSKFVEDKIGKRPVIYTSYNLYINWLSKALPDHDFWVANYSDKAYRFQQDNIIHWQYSEKGVIKGISGFVDLNYSKVGF